MHAEVGDTLTVKAVNQGEAGPARHDHKVHGATGEPPYLVRWHDDHESLFFTAAGTVVEPHPASGQRAAR
jgi:Domain of unknown function (DUF1918)